MKKLAFIFLVAFSSSSFSQTINDAGLWTTFSVEKKLKKKTSVFITEEFRLRENFTRLNLFYTDFGFAVKPFSALKVAFVYRSIQKFVDDNTFSYRHRLMLDITMKKKFDKFSISYRNQVKRMKIL